MCSVQHGPSASGWVRLGCSYPTFIDAIRDLDDPLCMVRLQPLPRVSGVPTPSRQSACRPQSPICTVLPPPHNKSNRLGARCSRQRSGCVTGREAVLCGRCTCMRHCRRPSTSTKRAQSAPPLARASAPLAHSRPHVGIASRTRRSFGLIIALLSSAAGQLCTASTRVPGLHRPHARVKEGTHAIRYLVSTQHSISAKAFLSWRHRLGLRALGLPEGSAEFPQLL